MKFSSLICFVNLNYNYNNNGLKFEFLENKKLNLNLCRYNNNNFAWIYENFLNPLNNFKLFTRKISSVG